MKRLTIFYTILLKVIFVLVLIPELLSPCCCLSPSFSGNMMSLNMMLQQLNSSIILSPTDISSLD